MKRFNPKPTLGVTKYGPKGLFTTDSFTGNLPVHWKEYLATIANYSLSKKTWSAYKTAGKLLTQCQTETKSPMTLPMNDDKVLIFVAWLLSRGLQSRTISTYLSGLRQVHLAKGILIPVLRPEQVKQILTGASNLDRIKARLSLKPTRLPVTATMMKLLKSCIKESQDSKERKRLLWAVATVLFNGAFRVHELLARTERQFDPCFTLLNKDLIIKTIKINNVPAKVIQILIKSPKTDRIGVDSIIDVYESKGPLCPVKALEKWKAVSNQRNCNLPAFCDNDGKPLTGTKFNNYLKSYLGKYINYKKGKITSHSFRAGMASLLGTLGYSDEDIQAVGRWSSRAFMDYLKLPRTRRLAMAKQIGNLVPN